MFVMNLEGNHRACHKLKNLKSLTPEQFEECIYKRKVCVERISQRWRSLDISALICPVYPSCAFKNKNAPDLTLFMEYVAYWNITHFPTGSVPVTEVTAEEAKVEYDDDFKDKWTRKMKEDVKGSEGMPIGVQVVSWPFEDEVALGVMKVIDEEVGYKKEFNE